MKTSKSVVALIGVLIGFVAGLIIGLFLTNPGMSLMEAAGTIGKVDKYRNVRITEEDIELRNELLATESVKESYKNYLLFEYFSNVKMVDDVQFSLQSIDKVPAFRSSCAQTISQMDEYATFLDNARLKILEAVGVIEGLNPGDKIAIRQVLGKAGNALAQTTYRNTVLFDYIDAVELFISENNEADYPDLIKSHDLLFNNLLASCLINDNRPMLKHLAEKDLLSTGEDLSMNREALLVIIPSDMEKLSFIIPDTEKLGICLDSEKLSVCLAVEQLPFSWDMEQLAAAQDSERLGVFDREQLGTIWDNEKLSDLVFAREDLQSLFPF